MLHKQRKIFTALTVCTALLTTPLCAELSQDLNSACAWAHQHYESKDWGSLAPTLQTIVTEIDKLYADQSCFNAIDLHNLQSGLKIFLRLLQQPWPLPHQEQIPFCQKLAVASSLETLCSEPHASVSPHESKIVFAFCSNKNNNIPAKILLLSLSGCIAQDQKTQRQLLATASNELFFYQQNYPEKIGRLISLLMEKLRNFIDDGAASCHLGNHADANLMLTIVHNEDFQRNSQLDRFMCHCYAFLIWEKLMQLSVQLYPTQHRVPTEVSGQRAAAASFGRRSRPPSSAARRQAVSQTVNGGFRGPEPRSAARRRIMGGGSREVVSSDSSDDLMVLLSQLRATEEAGASAVGSSSEQ